ncbi:hypothetical protein MTO96_047350 [Rhipicephalus appendiculatus]
MTGYGTLQPLTSPSPRSPAEHRTLQRMLPPPLRSSNLSTPLPSLPRRTAPAQFCGIARSPRGSGFPLPASDDEESMDMSSSRKRAREDSCDEDAQGPRKQLPTDYPADLPDDCGDDGPHTSIAATSSELESCADTSDTSVAPSPSAGNVPVAPAPAASQLQETDGMEASTDAEEHDAAQEHVSSAPPNPAAAFLRDPLCVANVVTRKKLKKKKNKKRQQGPLRDPMLVSSRVFHRRLFPCSPRYRLPEHLGVTFPLLPPRHSPPAAPSAQPSVDVLLANLLVTMQAVGAMLPADHPLRAIFLQAAAVQSSNTNHG